MNAARRSARSRSRSCAAAIAPALFARNDKDSLAFARPQKYGVLSTTAADGSPQSAVVGLAFGDDFDVVFDALGTMRKAATRAHRSGLGRRALVADRCVVDEPAAAENVWPTLEHLRVRPTWIRVIRTSRDRESR